MTSVILDGVFAEFLSTRRLERSAKDVRGLLEGLEEEFPTLRFRIRDETGEVRRYLKIFVNGAEIRTLKGQATKLGGHDTVDILHSIQGG
ncbi:MAG TPA: MoaD/ThiS family protein [Thermoplasmata archaeon]|nr:MoaD/ThiS family protein [Thermoplasmata archaeon]HEV2428966.1 MoaD/ThiS family protein [Thermoplasmata archaeon]